MQQKFILETPFLNLLYPLTVSNKGIQIEFKGQKILFELEMRLVCKELNLVNLIKKKRKHVKQIKVEVRHRQIEENLKSQEVQERIRVYKEKIEKELCS